MLPNHFPSRRIGQPPAALPTRPFVRVLLAIAMFWLPAALGCSPAEPGNPPAVNAANSKAVNSQGRDRADSGQSASGEASLDDAPANLVSETWDVHFMQGKKVGHRRTRVARVDDEGKLLRTEVVDSLEVHRFGQPVAVTIGVQSVETPAGEVRSFAYQLPLGQEVADVRGTVRDGKLTRTTRDGARSKSASEPWDSQTLGFFAVEQSLAAQPLQAGESRALRMLQLPPFEPIGTVELQALAVEATRLLAGEFRLLKIEQTLQLAGGQAMTSFLWTDEAGSILKFSQPQFQQETYRATRAEALRSPQGIEFDVGSDVVVRLAQQIDKPHERGRETYRIRMTDDDPARWFPAGEAQRVESLDARTIRVTVRAVRPNSLEAAPQSPQEPTEADLQPSSLLQSADPLIVKLATTAVGPDAGSAPNPDPVAAWNEVVALERFVHEYVEEKNYSLVFSSAAEVAAAREGDCTEHAVLLAAMCRARGIPARVAMGLVYHAPVGGFAYHMWDEAWIDGRWIGLDATLGRGGLGAGHLKLGHSSLSGSSAYSSFLPVLQVLGKLKIDWESMPDEE